MSGGGRYDERGFTLIEVVVALVLVSLILSIVGTGLRTLGATASLGTASLDRNEMLARGIGVLRRDLERLERLTETRGEQAEFLFSGDAGRLQMVLIEPPYPSDPGHYNVTYTVVRDGAVARLIRQRTPFQGFGAPPRPPSEADTVTVIEGSFDIRFSYLARSSGRTAWLTQWSDRRAIPTLVRLEVVAQIGGRALLPPIIIRPRLDAEAPCIDEDQEQCSARNEGMLPAISAKRKAPAKAATKPGEKGDDQ